MGRVIRLVFKDSDKIEKSGGSEGVEEIQRIRQVNEKVNKTGVQNQWAIGIPYQAMIK